MMTVEALVPEMLGERAEVSDTDRGINAGVYGVYGWLTLLLACAEVISDWCDEHPKDEAAVALLRELERRIDEAG